MQRPRFWHGLLWHSWTWVLQIRPVYPGWHSQEKVAMPSLHTPWWHGSGLQSLMLSSQSRPLKPDGRTFLLRIIAKATATCGFFKIILDDFFQSNRTWGYSLLPSAHSQSYPLGRSIHLAPFKQGVLEHSSMSIWHISPLKPENRSKSIN